MTKQARVPSLDFFRGICILGMIFVHTIGWYSLKGMNATLYIWHLTNFVAPGFILLIGMMVGFHYFPAAKTAQAVRKTCRRLAWRAGEVLVIIYAFSVPWYLVFRDPGASGASRFGESAAPDTVRSAQALWQILSFQRVNTRMTILVLIGFFLLLSVIVLLLRKFFAKWPAGFAVGVASYAAYRLLVNVGAWSTGGIFPAYVSYYFLQWTFPFLAYALYYFIGVSLGVLLDKAGAPDARRLYARLLTLAGGIAAAVFLISGFAMRGAGGAFPLPVDYRVPVHHQYYVFFSLGSCFLYLGLAMMLEKLWLGARGLYWITLYGRHSLFAYVFHWLAIQAGFLFLVRIYAPRIMPRLGIPEEAVACVMVAATIAVVALAVFIEHRLLKRRRTEPHGFAPNS